jgi:hypothetical protein
LKTTLLVAAAATLISAGAYMHGGHKPRCLMQLFAKEKLAVKAATPIASLATESDSKAKMKKHHEMKAQDANSLQHHR